MKNNMTMIQGGRMRMTGKHLQDGSRMLLAGKYRLVRCLICVLTVLALTVTGCKKTADDGNDKPAAGTENVTEPKTIMQGTAQVPMAAVRERAV